MNGPGFAWEALPQDLAECLETFITALNYNPIPEFSSANFRHLFSAVMQCMHLHLGPST
jgi:hypothetical protein